jgi:hypothetical protein
MSEVHSKNIEYSVKQKQLYSIIFPYHILTHENPVIHTLGE